MISTRSGGFASQDADRAALAHANFATALEQAEALIVRARSELAAGAVTEAADLALGAIDLLLAAVRP